MSDYTWSPLCMTPDEWADWQRLNPLAWPKQAVLRPCHDCPQSFSSEQRAAGHCNGVPGQEEEPMDEHQARGAEATRARIASERADLAEVVVHAPCASCVHASVCRHKAVLDALGDVTVKGMPELPDAIVLVVAADVSCRWYVRSKPAGLKRPQTEAQLESRRRNATVARAKKAQKAVVS